MAGYVDNPFLAMITQSSILAYLLVSCLNRLTDKSSQIKQRLQTHANETICFRIDPVACLSVTVMQDGHFTAAARDMQATVIFEIPVEIVPRIISGEMAIFDKIIICGDPELADTLLYIGRVFQAEIEENLSSILGDVLTRRVTLTGQKLVRWHLGSIHNLSQALSGFLSEEQSVTASRTRFHQFASGVGSVQQQISQLEERITTLIPLFSPIADNLPRTGR